MNRKMEWNGAREAGREGPDGARVPCGRVVWRTSMCTATTTATTRWVADCFQVEVESKADGAMVAYWRARRSSGPAKAD